MNQLFEYSDKLNNPYECFICSNLLHSVPVKPHFHYFVEILYMCQGSILVNCDGESYILSPGDLMLFLPSTVHSIYAVSDEPFYYEVLKFDPAPFGSHSPGAFGSSINLSALFASARRRTAPASSPSGKQQKALFPDASFVPQKNVSADIFFSAETLQRFPVASLFHSCITEMEQKQYGYQTLLHAKIQELLTYILRLWRENGFDTDALYAPAEQQESIYSITEYIDSHLCSDLRVEQLASWCGMSYSYFAKNFREVYGQSCKKYIESMRLSKVENMLLFTGFDLNYISQETGFSDCSHLIRAFKGKYGITPHQYRLRHHV